MKVTKESLITSGACYSEHKIDALPIPPDGATPRQVAEYTEIPTNDRIWALCNAVICSSEQEAAHYERQLPLFALYCAEDAMNNEIAEGRMPHKDLLEVLEVIKKYLNGEATKEELRIAKEKAHYAANNAAYYAARTAYHAVYRAAYSAACYAAYNDPVELQKYLDKLVEMLEPTYR
jgi:hypothetical protein